MKKIKQKSLLVNIKLLKEMSSPMQEDIKAGGRQFATGWTIKKGSKTH